MVKRLLVITLAIALVSCDREPTEPSAAVVATIDIEAARSELVPDDSLQLTAVARDAARNVLHGLAASWRSSDTTVATVDRGGMLRAIEAGDVTVFAEAQGVTAMAQFTVLGVLVDSDVVVVDSMQAMLVSDSAELEAGTLVFEMAPGAPEPAIGDVIVGAQRGGFLGRVTDVNQAGNRLTLQTSGTALAEVLDAGVVSLSVPIVASADVAPRRGPGVGLGPPRVEYALAPVAATEDGWAFDPIRIAVELCPGDDPDVATCVTAALTLPNARLTFTDASADIDVRWGILGLRALRFILTGDATWQSDVELSLASTGRVAAACRLAEVGTSAEPPDARRCPTIRRPLLRVAYPFLTTLGPIPVVGDVVLAVDLVLSFDVSGGITVTTDVLVNAPLRAGVEWARRGGVDFVFQPELSGEVSTPQLELVAELGSRLALVPSLSLRFYRSLTGFLDLAGYVRAALTGASRGDFELGIYVGIETVLGARFAILDRLVAEVSTTLFAAETQLVGFSVLPRVFAASGQQANQPPSDLYVVEVSPTGKDSLIGRIRTSDGTEPVITDIAASPAGHLWAISFTTLYRLDRETGTLAQVGSLGVSGANALAFDNGGDLFAATDAGSLFRVDTLTGEATEVGALGGGFGSSGDLAFSLDGTLLGTVRDAAGTNFLVLVDRATGEATPVSPGVPIGFDNVFGLAFVGESLFGLTTDTGSAGGQLIALDISNGTGSLVRNLAFDAFGAGGSSGTERDNP